MGEKIGFLLPAEGGDRTWIDGALAARDALVGQGHDVATEFGVPDRIPEDWSIAVCHGIQYEPLLASGGRNPDQSVILSDIPARAEPYSNVTSIDWAWHKAFYCAGAVVQELARNLHAVTFIAGSPVATQRRLVDFFLRGMLESATAVPVRVTYLPRFDDAETARKDVAANSGDAMHTLCVSSSDAAGLVALETARNAGAPTVSFLTGLQTGDVAAVTSDIPGILTRLVARAVKGETLPERYEASFARREIALRLSVGAAGAATRLQNAWETIS